VYWTLEVELCFYAIFSVLFYLWRGNSTRVIATYFALGVALWILGSTKTFPVYMLTFVVGVLLADVLVRGAPLRWCLPLAVAALVIVYFRAGPISVTFCAIAAVAIYLFYEVRVREWMMFLGTVSYSLYLTHTLAAFFGEFLIRRLLPFHGTDVGKCLLVFVYIAFAVGWSYAFYRVIEAPVVRVARALR
jgi:peptidoglycan/LPS O-acetylase OafA/YrhL